MISIVSRPSLSLIVCMVLAIYIYTASNKPLRVRKGMVMENQKLTRAEVIMLIIHYRILQDFTIILEETAWGYRFVSVASCLLLHILYNRCK